MQVFLHSVYQFCHSLTKTACYIYRQVLHGAAGNMAAALQQVQARNQQLPVATQVCKGLFLIGVQFLLRCASLDSNGAIVWPQWPTRG